MQILNLHGSKATKFSLVILACLFIGVSSPAFAPPVVCGDTPLILTELTPLEFGSVAGDANSPGTVVINPNTGAKTLTGAAVDFGGSDSPATWRIEGDKQCNVIVTLPGTITMTSGGGSMDVRDFTSSSPNPVTIPNSRKIDIEVGATGDVGVNQGAGSYTGSYTFTVNYE